MMPRAGIGGAGAMLSPMRPWLADVTRAGVRADFIAGVTNAAVALPQGVAFATIAGLSPEYGLFALMVPTLVAAWWGSSSVMMSGPTTAISAVVLATLTQFATPGTADYVTLALTLTIFVGALQLIAGLMRLGGLISFVSHSVIVGFTAVAALLIAASQLAPAMGIPADHSPNALGRFQSVLSQLSEAQWPAMMVCVTTIGTIIAAQWIDRRLPAYMLGLAAGALVGAGLSATGLVVDTFAPLPSVLPRPLLPNPSMSDVAALAPGALSIALVGLLEAISIGRVFALRRGEAYDPNQEIVGQGLSNLAGGMFQAYASSGSFTRSGLNADAGGRTPLAALFAVVALIGMLVILAPLVVFIPIPAIAGVILCVAWRLIDLDEIRHIMLSRGETLILVATFVTGVLTDLEFAIVVGVLASLAVLLKEIARPYVGVGAPALLGGRRRFINAERHGLVQCPRIALWRLEGLLCFASVDQVAQAFRRLEAKQTDQTIKILTLKGVGKLDLAGADFLVREIREARRKGGELHIISVLQERREALERLGVLGELGSTRLHRNKQEAVAAAVQQVAPDHCRICRARVFVECGGRPSPDDPG